MMKRLSIAGMAMALLVAATPASAAPVNEDGLTLAEIATWLQKSGYQAETIKDKDGEEYIRSAAEGMTFIVMAKDCKKGRCLSIQMNIGFDLPDGLTLEKANEWNSQYRWAMMYLDGDRDPNLSMDVSLTPGVTYEGLADQLELWTNAIAHGKTFLDW